MEELGLKFSEAREDNVISLEEAAEDLGVPIEELDNLEKGNIKFFDNVLRVRQLIEKYGKYLGLDYENMVENFNEYLFDFTSKISVEAIKKAKKKEESGERVKSPYTVENNHANKILLVVGLIIVILIIAFIIFRGG